MNRKNNVFFPPKNIIVNIYHICFSPTLTAQLPYSCWTFVRGTFLCCFSPLTLEDVTTRHIAYFRWLAGVKSRQGGQPEALQQSWREHAGYFLPYSDWREGPCCSESGICLMWRCVFVKSLCWTNASLTRRGLPGTTRHVHVGFWTGNHMSLAPLCAVRVPE